MPQKVIRGAKEPHPVNLVFFGQKDLRAASIGRDSWCDRETDGLAVGTGSIGDEGHS